MLSQTQTQTASLKLFEKDLGPKQQQDLYYYKGLFARSLQRGDLPTLPDPVASPHLHLWYQHMTSLFFLSPFLENHKVNEIILQSPQEIQVDENGILKAIHLEQMDKKDLKTMLEGLGLKQGITWNYANPFASFTLKLPYTFLRATLIHESITPDATPKLFLRKIKDNPYSFDDFELPPKDQELIKQMIADKENIIVAGATSSGKTSFVKSMLGHVPLSQHLVILEDAHELKIPRSNCTHLISAPPQGGGITNSKTLKDYCSYALRLRPDRIILGEIRGEEVVPFLLAMNTGHKGLISTLHANSAADAISRLCLLFAIYNRNGEIQYQTVKDLVTKDLHRVIFMENKRIKEIIKIT